ncbi:hypothetical protein ACIA8E_18395 [Streptomyces sp. NPDC051664]|uniref:hypothetical protein n=1 Tax=Streptomyces sp. NPDC051664 TaxID=3365668 RepID=UPI00379100AF
MAATTRIPVQGPLDDPELPQGVRGMRPAGFAEAEAGDILASGPAIRFDADGKPRHEHQLVGSGDIARAARPVGRGAVFHDIWGQFDFRGLPHPEIHQRNAPPLSAALQAVTLCWAWLRNWANPATRNRRQIWKSWPPMWSGAMAPA